jgi:hypothetical protein
MDSIEQRFNDTMGNPLMVALNFLDKDYKIKELQIPEEFSNIEIADIDITKKYTDRPISPATLFRMSEWLLDQFNKSDAIFTYICSYDELETNHLLMPSIYRSSLFNSLWKRVRMHYEYSNHIRIQDVEIGEDEFHTFARAFYRDKHAPIINLILAHLQSKSC